jgi:adenylate kinase
MRHGELVPDNIVEAMLVEELALASANPLFDGFPRTAEQARFVDEQLAVVKRKLDAAIYLYAPTEVLVQRLDGRLACTGCPAMFHVSERPPQEPHVCDACGGELVHREDDLADLVASRLRSFRHALPELVAYYEDSERLVPIDATGSVDDVRARLDAVVAAVQRGEPIVRDLGALAHVADWQEPEASHLDETGNFVLLGGPGSGKGTQAETLSKHLAVPHISTGDLFRYNLKNGTPLGKLAKSHMERGELVPDNVTEAMVEDRLTHEDAHDGFLLDGFPRNPSQARALTHILADAGRRLSGVIAIDVGDDEIVRRLSGRLTCSECQASFHRVFRPPETEGVCDRCQGELIQRPDDNPDSIRARLGTYHTQTEPVADYYRAAGLIIPVAGEKPPSEVSEDIIAQLDALQ